MGLKIVTYRITVEQRDIDRANQISGPVAATCPIALAASRVADRHVLVLFRELVIHSLIGETRFNLPVVARRFIQRFDRQDFVEPFSFYVSRRERAS